MIPVRTFALFPHPNVSATLFCRIWYDNIARSYTLSTDTYVLVLSQSETSLLTTQRNNSSRCHTLSSPVSPGN